MYIVIAGYSKDECYVVGRDLGHYEMMELVAELNASGLQFVSVIAR